MHGLVQVYGNPPRNRDPTDDIIKERWYGINAKGSADNRFAKDRNLA